MKLIHVLLIPGLAAAFAASALAQQPTPPAEEIPDGPAPTAAVMTRPNGPMVVMDTSMGRIVCQFYERQAPKAVANFIALAEGTKDWIDPVSQKKQHGKPLYIGTTFHRVIPEFMIQGGDPAGTGIGDPGYQFEDEVDPNLAFDQPGRLAMANSGPNTNGSQFFITEAAVDTLNMHYSLFGQCDEASVLVVKTIARVERDSQDKPLTPVILKKVTIVREGQPLPPKPGETAIAPVPGQASTPGGHPESIDISGGVAMGLLEDHPGPIYPIEAKQAGVSGGVVLGAVIGTDGLVKELHVIRGPELLQKAAMDAVSHWRYRPYLLNNQPVEVKTQINVIFTLGK